MIIYLIHTTSIWTILFIAYKVLLSKEKYFTLNRGYLLASLALGLLLPLVQFVNFSTQQVMPEVSAIYHEQVNYISQLSASITASSIESSSINWTSIIFIIISSGMALMLFRNVIAGFKIKSLYQHSEKLRHPEFTEVRTQKEHLPFSFFRYIFFSAFALKEENRLTILNHEIHHVRAKHTWDVLFVEAIKVFFWWNPIVYLYKKAITENHEFAADHAAIAQGSRKDYCSLLLQSNMPGVNLNLGHPFFQTYIKKRIDMMYRKNSNWKSYLKFLLPVIAIVFMAFIIKEDKLELDYSLNSDYIDLFADDLLLVPGEDYVIDRERGKVIILNAKSSSTKGPKYCMFIIEEPRPLSDFQDAQKPVVNNFVLVKLNANGTMTVGSKEMETNAIFELVKELQNKCGEEVYVKLAIDGKVENNHVVKFLDEAFILNAKVELEYEEGNVRYDIPAISPLAPKDVITENGFGMRMHPVHKKMKMHKGLDLVAKMGTPVFATADGMVTKVQSNRVGYGRHIVVDHGNGYVTLYAHLNEYIVTENDEVKQGQQIGFVGNSGESSSPHLHYEVKLDNEAVDPINYGAIPFKKPRFHRELGEEAEKLFEAKKIDKQKLIEGSKKLFGVEDLDFEEDTTKGTIINLGPNVNRGVIVKASDLVLTESLDYEIDYQLGRLKILNEDYLNADQPIKVEFASNESDQNIYNVNGKEVVAKKVESDMTFSDCKSNDDGLYYRSDKRPTLQSCDLGNVEDDYTCSQDILTGYINENLVYPESLVEAGFEGGLIYNVIVDEKGVVDSYKELLRDHKKKKLPELEAEGTRILELIKSTQKFNPAECDGEKVKGLLHLSIFFRLDDEQKKRVTVRDASNTSKSSQRVVIDRIASGGGAFTYTSDMNSPYVVKIIDPKGVEIFNETYNFLYDYSMDGFSIPNDMNGFYKIEVTQDGQTVSSSMECKLF